MSKLEDFLVKSMCLRCFRICKDLSKHKCTQSNKDCTH